MLAEEGMEVGRISDLSLTLVQDMAKKAEVDYTVEIDQGLPGLIADPAKLTQILVNLLSNAIKFTPRGGKVRLKIKHRLAGGIGFHVEDTGICMSAKEI